MCITYIHEVHINFSEDPISEKKRLETKHEFVLVATRCNIHLHICRIGGRGMAGKGVPKVVVEKNCKFAFHATKPHIKEWIVNSQTTVK